MSDETGLQKSLKFNLMSDAPGTVRASTCPSTTHQAALTWVATIVSTPHCLPSSCSPSRPLPPRSHQVVQELPPANTFVGTRDTTSTGSEQYLDYSYRTTP